MLQNYNSGGQRGGVWQAQRIADRFFAIMLISLILTPGFIVAAETPKTRETLQKELQNIQQQIEEARTNLTATGKTLWNQQHDLEYADPDCVKLREEIKALEAQVIEKRQQLDARLKAKEPIRAIENQRKQLIENLRTLVEKEKLIFNEIKALDSSEGLKEEAGK